MNALILLAGIYGATTEWKCFRGWLFLLFGAMGLLATWYMWKSHEAVIERITGYQRGS
jgi:hypothetical protein